MPKEKLKHNAKLVGVAPLGDPHFEELTKQKRMPVGAKSIFARAHRGITLIALIITIIVMLILVGVSVSVALNGGLFQVAKRATTKTEIEIEREQLLAALIGATGEKGNLDLNKISANLPEEFQEIPEEATDTTRTYIAKSGNKYVVDIDREIIYIGQGPQISVLTLLQEYILGEKDEKTGKRIGRELSGIFDLENFDFIKESIPPELKNGNLEVVNYGLVSTEVVEKMDTEGKTTYEPGINYDFYFRYEDVMYKFRARLNTDKTEGITLAESGVRTLLYDKTSKLGKYVRYDGIDWIVLYDDNENGLQMISKDVIKDESNQTIKYNLGFTDNAFAENKVTEIDGIIGKSDLEKTMYSYSEAIKTLNKICEDLVTAKEGIIKGVRSVGSNPIMPNEDNGGSFIGSKDTIVNYNEKPETWFEDELNLQLNKTGEKTYYTIKNTNPAQEYIIKNTDYNYEKDFDRMITLGINETSADYWLASRFLETSIASVAGTTPSTVSASVRLVKQGDIRCNYLWGARPGRVNSWSRNSAVRPVVSLEPTILNSVAGEGTENSPFEIN